MSDRVEETAKMLVDHCNTVIKDKKESIIYLKHYFRIHTRKLSDDLTEFNRKAFARALEIINGEIK